MRRTGLNGTRRSPLATALFGTGPAWAATSFSTMRPAGPDPVTSARLTSSMRAARRASGVARIESGGATVAASMGAAGFGELVARSMSPVAANGDVVFVRSTGAGNDAPASASASIQPTTVPTATGSPVIGARSRMTPLAGDSTSITDLLVSISNRIWPCRTRSPGATFHSVMIPSSMSMSTLGRMTSIGIRRAPRAPGGAPRRRCRPPAGPPPFRAPDCTAAARRRRRAARSARRENRMHRSRRSSPRSRRLCP
jgi:hypothetical protein